jgi:hypothetical protein
MYRQSLFRDPGLQSDGHSANKMWNMSKKSEDLKVVDKRKILPLNSFFIIVVDSRAVDTRVARSQKIKKGQIWPEAVSKKAKFSNGEKGQILKENLPKYINYF